MDQVKKLWKSNIFVNLNVFTIQNVLYKTDNTITLQKQTSKNENIFTIQK